MNDQHTCQGLLDHIEERRQTTDVPAHSSSSDTGVDAILKEYNIWYLLINKHEYSIAIGFCPFCGQNLGKGN